MHDIVYFKVAAIILSYKIKYVCGYKIAIDKISEYITLTASTVTLHNIASLGDHKIPDENNVLEKNEDYFVVSDSDTSSDKEQYFTALR